MKPTITLDGAELSTFDDFWRTYRHQIDPDSARFMGKNLDAWYDATHGGGPGYPGECILHLKNCAKLEALFPPGKFEIFVEIARTAPAIELQLD